MKSVSGIRGIVGDTFTPELIVKVGSAFAEYTSHGTVVVGRDSRITGETASMCLSSALIMAGCNVVDVGIVPTPTVQIMVEELKADGGIILSASHNPIEWNAFKLVDRTGTFLNEEQVKRFFSILDGESHFVAWDKFGSLIKPQINPFHVHIDKVLDVVDTQAIKNKRFSVALDSVDGAGSLITQEMLNKLKCKIFPVFCTITGTFPRVAEPLAENLTELSRSVQMQYTDIGFAQDPDADRLAIVDERGNAVGEECTIALVTEHLLSKKKGRVVVNLSTSKMAEDIAAKYKCEFMRTKVGEINVADEMRKNGARIGGEGNGGVISPEVHLGRDSLVGIAYILEMMAVRQKSISELVAELPQYVMRKGKVSFNPESLPAIMKNVKLQYKNERISDIDGVRIDFDKDENFCGGWVHLRASNTEPVFRIITEGKTAAQADAIYEHFAKMVL